MTIFFLIIIIFLLLAILYNVFYNKVLILKNSIHLYSIEKKIDDLPKKSQATHIEFEEDKKKNSL